MSYRLEHPLSGTVYSSVGDGRVEVSKDGVTGVFDMHGHYIAGALEIADPEMVRWVGTHGYTIESRHRLSFGETSAHDVPVLDEERS